MGTLSQQIIRFGQFELDVDAGELRRDGRPVKLQPQPFRLLLLVVKRAGILVTRDEIRAELWGDGTYVDFDQAVNFAVRQIRDALGDAADRPLYLQTVPRRGYRFIAPVDTGGMPEVGPDSKPSGNTVRLQKALWANVAEIRLAQRRQKRLAVLAIAVAAVTVLGVLTYVLMTR